MKGLPFSEPMVKVWLEGRKTVTRRLIGGIDSSFFVRERRSAENLYLFTKMSPDEKNPDGAIGIYVDKWVKPRYLPGETVYIRESCYICGSDTDGAPLADPPVVYRADGARKSDEYPHVRSPRFMPEWAARSHARIVSVRPERVQEIPPQEVKKEGLVVQDFAGINMLALLGLTPETYMEQVAIMEFQALWESLHPGSWGRNDWVWRIELEKTA